MISASGNSLARWMRRCTAADQLDYRVIASCCAMPTSARQSSLLPANKRYVSDDVSRDRRCNLFMLRVEERQLGPLLASLAPDVWKVRREAGPLPSSLGRRRTA